MSAIAVRNGLDAEMLVDFAELVFAYIDELSAASVAGHTDETETTGRVRQRLLERVGQPPARPAPRPTRSLAAAERAGWAPPTTLTAVLVPESQVRPVLGLVAPGTLAGRPTRPASSRRRRCSWCPTRTPRRRTALLRTLGDRGSHRRARACRGSTCARRTTARSGPAPLGLELDTEAAPAPAGPARGRGRARRPARPRARAPLADLRPGTAEKLADTLRAWLLHQGRRDDVAAALFVHPQTVRYRMGQLRELYGDRLDDPDTVLALTIALA